MCLHTLCYLILKDVLTGQSDLGRERERKKKKIYIYIYIYICCDSGVRNFRLGLYDLALPNVSLYYFEILFL